VPKYRADHSALHHQETTTLWAHRTLVSSAKCLYSAAGKLSLGGRGRIVHLAPNTRRYDYDRPLGNTRHFYAHGGFQNLFTKTSGAGRYSKVRPRAKCAVVSVLMELPDRTSVTEAQVHKIGLLPIPAGAGANAGKPFAACFLEIAATVAREELESRETHRGGSMMEECLERSQLVHKRSW
jgi:hypothetical protein